MFALPAPIPDFTVLLTLAFLVTVHVRCNGTHCDALISLGFRVDLLTGAGRTPSTVAVSDGKAPE